MIYECYLKRRKTRLFLLTTASTKRKESRYKKPTRVSLKIEKKGKPLEPELSGK